MSISGVNGIGATAYAYMNSSMKTTGEGNFASEVQKAEERQSTTSTTSAWAGDMVISQPPNYSGFTYDSSISNKTKEEMTMDEYKQWVMNEMSQMPVSGWYRSTCVGGSLIITDEAFEKMKSVSYGDASWHYNRYTGYDRNGERRSFQRGCIAERTDRGSGYFAVRWRL